jgi:CheY-like chemotaxis protein
VTPEVLIVGDPTGRRGFADQVEALGYGVSLCQPRELNRRVRTSNPPAAIVACIGDIDPDVLLAGLRRTRAGASIPVLLYGRLGGNLRDLADVLDIGADHFLEEPISAAELASALNQYAGAPRRDDDPPPASRRPVAVRSRPAMPERTPPVEHAGESEPASPRRLPTEPRPAARSPTPERARPREPVLGDLHRTLDRLEARLRGREDSDPELASLGLDSIPDVEHDEGELDDDEPLVTEIGEHLRGRGEVYEPVRGEDRRSRAGELEERSRVASLDRRPPTRPLTTTTERLPDRVIEPVPERSPALRSRTKSEEGTSRGLPRPPADERTPVREATGRWGRAPEPRAERSRVEPSRTEPSRAEPSRSAPDPARGSAVLLGRRPDRPTRGPAPPNRPKESDERDEPWPRSRPSPLARDRDPDLDLDLDLDKGDDEDDDEDDDDDDTGRVQSREGETRTRALRPDRDRGPLQVGSALREGERERPREDDRERATIRLDGPPRPLRAEQSPWQAEPRPRPSAAARPRIDTSLREAGQLGGDIDVPGLLWQLHQQRFTGRLRLHRQRIEKQLWMHEGELVFARSNATSDRLIDGLLRRGVLTRPQYETARRLAAKEPRRAGQLLVDAGFLKPRELEMLLRDHLARVIDSTFAWSEGSFSTEPGERTDEPIQLDLAMPVLLLDGLRHRFEPGELEQALLHAAGRGPLVPRLRESLGRDQAERVAVAAEQLRLLPEEESMLARFDGRHGVAALLAEGADDLALFALLRVLELAGMVDLAHADELGLAAHGGDDSRAPAQVDSERILERLRLAREGDYFELLGLARDAARSEIRQAHAGLLSTFADSALEPESRTRHARELRELRSAIEEALDILADDAMRSAYLAHLQEPD